MPQTFMSGLIVGRHAHDIYVVADPSSGFKVMPSGFSPGSSANRHSSGSTPSDFSPGLPTPEIHHNLAFLSHSPQPVVSLVPVLGFPRVFFLLFPFFGVFHRIGPQRAFVEDAHMHPRQRRQFEER